VLTEIKICGITNIEDALHAAACGADALGFIFYGGSPRCITPEAAARIVHSLPKEVARVGVFVNEKPETILAIRKTCSLDRIQLHGEESLEYCRRFPRSVLIKALPVLRGESPPPLRDYPVGAFLLDTADGERRGGTGREADWGLAARIAEEYPLILAGGLCESNIARALARVGPSAVDINSGVEASPGKKDPEKVRRVIDIVRRCDDGRPKTGRLSPENFSRNRLFNIPENQRNSENCKDRRGE